MNKTTKERSFNIFSLLGFKTKEQRQAMTNEDWNKFNAEYKTKYGVSFNEDLEAADQLPAAPPSTEGNFDSENVITAEQQTQILTALADFAETSGAPAPQSAPQTSAQVIEQFITAMNTATQTIRTLSAQPEPATPVATASAASAQTIAVVLGHSAHSASHIFGIENEFFARNHWWNEVAATRRETESIGTQEVESFNNEFTKFTKGLKDRVNTLAISGEIQMLDFKKIVSGESYIDYQALETQFGAQYLVRRQDALIAYLRTLKSVAGIFPVRSGVQDKEAAVNAFFGEFSQTYIEGDVFKGNVKFTPEIYHVDDVMLKKRFSNLKKLEKEYIGYLNSEGSSPIKWTFIEWLLTNIYTALFNEQQRRRVIGVKVPEQVNVENPAMFAADGVLRVIERAIEEKKILPFFDLKIYDNSTILDYFENLWEKVNQILPSMDGMIIYANEKHKSWYVKAYRAAYGSDTDFTGVNKNGLIDFDTQIVWVPNMENTDYRVWITLAGNIENYELTPGEMYGVYFERRLESLISASWWKEGAGAKMIGMQCASIAELEATGRKYHYIFCNYPVTVLEDGATTANALYNHDFETSANTAATALTDITNASIERVYKIICGSLTNKTTITKAGKFEKISADWIPAAIGDYIKVYAELTTQAQVINGKTVNVTVPTGKFLEFESKVTA
ncbi:MAG: hypothetical protein LBN95_06525 [Prevotellaceae bacterium]|jgi:hypothetical protein|nr:hypothetical protein [Prevotellaceae bacterium]